MTIDQGTRVRWNQAPGQVWAGTVKQTLGRSKEAQQFVLVRIDYADSDHSSDLHRFHVVILHVDQLLPDEPTGPSSNPSGSQLPGTEKTIEALAEVAIDALHNLAALPLKTTDLTEISTMIESLVRLRDDL